MTGRVPGFAVVIVVRIVRSDLMAGGIGWKGEGSGMLWTKEIFKMILTIIETALKAVGAAFNVGKLWNSWKEKRKRQPEEERWVIDLLRNGPGNCLKFQSTSPWFGVCERMANNGNLARVAGGGYMLPEFGGYHGESIYSMNSKYLLY
jgi:hypothetical protein